jgi:hypothetical protein
MQNHISNTNWYFKYQLVFQIPIGISNTNWYFKYQLVFQIPIGISNTNWYFKIQIPIGTSKLKACSLVQAFPAINKTKLQIDMWMQVRTEVSI